MKYTCIRKLSRDWPRFTCGEPAKFYTDGIHSIIPLCGLHADLERRKGRAVKPITAVSEDGKHG